MWVHLREGFFSAVENWNDKKTVIVRARCKQHIVQLADSIGIGRSEIKFTPDNDYCSRIEISKKTWGEFLKTSGEGINYHNVKGTLATNDNALHHAMMECWSAMNDYQETVEGVGLYVRKNAR